MRLWNPGRFGQTRIDLESRETNPETCAMVRDVADQAGWFIMTRVVSQVWLTGSCAYLPSSHGTWIALLNSRASVLSLVAVPV